VIIQSNFTLYIPPGTSYYDKEVIIMALTGEDLAEISKLLDVKFESELAPIKKDIKNIKHALETDKKIQLSAENYVPAASRFEEASCKINSMQSDINLLKKIVTEHSEKIRKLA
jgi:hypothetical protein